MTVRRSVRQGSTALKSVALMALLVGASFVAPAPAVADTAGGQASGYLAYTQSVNICTGWKPAFNQSLTHAEGPHTAQSTTATVTGLTPRASYAFQVLAIDPGGNLTPIPFTIVGLGSGNGKSVVISGFGTTTLSWSQTPNANAFEVQQKGPGDTGFVDSKVRAPVKVGGTFPFVSFYNPTANDLTFPLIATPTRPGEGATAVTTVKAGQFARVVGLPGSLLPPTLLALAAAVPESFTGTVTANGCPRELFAIAGSATLTFDELAGQFLGTLNVDFPVPNCQFWTPLFMNGQNGWSSTLAVHNEANAPLAIQVELRPLGAASRSSVVTREYDLPANGFRQISAADLGLPDGFAGSLSAAAVLTPNSPVQACEISGVVYHEAPGANRISVAAIPFLGLAAANVFLPFAYHAPSGDAAGWTSRVLIRSTGGETPIEARALTADGQLVSQILTVPGDAAIELDLDAMGAPAGVLSIEVRGLNGAPPAVPVIATAYHFGPGGAAAALNNLPAPAHKSYLPALYRNANGGDSVITVQNVTATPAVPRLTFTDRDSGATTVVIADAGLREGQAQSWDLATVPGLEDGHSYAAVVDTSPDLGELLATAARQVSAATGTAILAEGLSIPDSTPASVRVRGLTAPLVYNHVEGLGTVLVFQNLEVTAQAVTLRFLNNVGTEVATAPVSLPANYGAATLEVATVPGLADGFVGSVVMRPSGAAAVVVLTTRAGAAVTSAGDTT
ncbi:MAG: hypothetical protein QOF51_2312 [Chloroflexota bacterium]|nr:hypothetical protein [Chloroflexota bacterium]